MREHLALISLFLSKPYKLRQKSFGATTVFKSSTYCIYSVTVWLSLTKKEDACGAYLGECKEIHSKLYMYSTKPAAR